MLIQQTLSKIEAIGLSAMATGLREQLENPAQYLELSFEDRLGLLVDREADWRDSRRLATRLKAAKLRHPATVEDIDFRAPRGLDRALILSLAQAGWVHHHQNLILTGATGCGKSYLACALAHAAIRQDHTALYVRTPRLLDDLAVGRGDGRYARLLGQLQRMALLVLDDFLLSRPRSSSAAISWRSSKTAPSSAPPWSPASSPSTPGTPPWPTPPWPRRSWIASSTRPTGSPSKALPCAAASPKVTPLRDTSARSARERPCPACGLTFLADPRRVWCSQACRQRGYRQRLVASDAAPAVFSRRLPKAAIVYQCPECDTRYLGEQRCPDCQVFCRRLGPGGECPHCSEPVAVVDVAPTAVIP